MMTIRDKAIEAAQKAIADNLLDVDPATLHYPAVAAFDAVMTTLRDAAAIGSGSWCFTATRRKQVVKQAVVHALGAGDFHMGDDEIFVACLDAINPPVDQSPSG